MKLRTDTLAISVYARHGDTCGLEDSYGHHDSLGCASGHKASDYVLVARFAYLQEAIEYCQSCSERGVKMRLVSRLVPNIPYVSDYPKDVRTNATRMIDATLAERAQGSEHGQAN